MNIIDVKDWDRKKEETKKNDEKMPEHTHTHKKKTQPEQK